jgi:hypothetical protein
MKTENRVASGGITFLQLLQLTFIILKLCGVIAWPWPVVLIPFWIDLAIIIMVALIFVIIFNQKRH